MTEDSMRVLITGGSGMLGANLAYYFTQHRTSWEIHLQYHTHSIAMPGAFFHQADLLDEEVLSSLLDDIKPDLIVHCAALTNLDYCEQHPDFARAINAGVTLNVVNCARDTGSRVIYISSDSIFGQECEVPFSEDDVPHPLSIYARTKLEGEQAVLTMGQNSLVLRTCIFGINPTPRQSLAEWMVTELSAGNPIQGFTDTIFNPILCTDLVQAILIAEEHNLSGIFHINGVDVLSKYDFAVMVANTFGYDPALVQAAEMVNCSFAAPRPRAPILSSRKFNQITGYMQPTIKMAVESFYQQYINGYRTTLKSFFQLPDPLIKE